VTETNADFQSVLARLELLEDREQIRGVISRYSRGVDRTDPDAARSTLWPEAQLVVGAVEELGKVRDTAATFIDPLFGKYIGEILAATHHMVGNMIIDVHGKTARAETYAVAHHLTYPTEQSNDAVVGLQNIRAEDRAKVHELVIGLRYLDRFEKRGKVWKIIERKLVFDWCRHGLFSGVESGGLWGTSTKLRGARKPEDPSYEYFHDTGMIEP